MDQRTRLLAEVLEALYRGGFEVSDRCGLRPSCFDLFARRQVMLMLLKVLTNIDGLGPGQAGDIQRMARMLSASPVLVGEKTREADMEEGVLYERYGVPAVSPETFQDMVQGVQPVVISSRRGLYVNVNGDAIRKMREDRGMSTGDVAREMGVSKKAVYNYEQGNTRPTLENALKIEELFDETVATPVDLGQWHREKVEAKAQNSEPDPVMDRLKEMGFQVEVVKRAPFDALTLESKEVLLTKVVEAKLRRIKERAKLIGSISKTTRTGAFMVSDKTDKENIAGVPVIGRDELERFGEAEDLLIKVLERMPRVGS